MLEYQLHQAAGLTRIRAQSGPHLVAITAHGDTDADLPLLWKLCDAYLELGYGVTVLDATRAETAEQPGLTRLLEDGFWPGGQNQPEAAWQILPAARGLQQLCTRSYGVTASWQHLGHLFADDTVVLVYAGAQALAALLAGSGTRPLLTVSSAKNALLTSYQALKRLLMDGGLEPTVVDIGALDGSGLPQHAAHAVSNLTECARNFLGYQVRLHTLGGQPRGARQDYDLKPLAARLLEFGLDLGHPASGTQPLASGPQHAAFAGTH